MTQNQESQQSQKSLTQIGSDTTLNKPGTSRQHNFGTLLSGNEIIELWATMGSIYGHRWLSTMGSATDQDGEFTATAKIWKAGLANVTVEQMQAGISKMILDGDEWFPSLPKFRSFCICRDDIPCIQEIIKIIQKEPFLSGNVVERYKHSIVLAIVKNKTFSRESFRNGSQERCEAIIKPILEYLVTNGWSDFLPEHHETPLVIEFNPTPKAAALEHLARIKQLILDAPEAKTLAERVSNGI